MRSRTSDVASDISVSESNNSRMLHPSLSDVVVMRLRLDTVRNSPSAGIAISASTCSGVALG